MAIDTVTKHVATILSLHYLPSAHIRVLYDVGPPSYKMVYKPSNYSYRYHKP